MKFPAAVLENKQTGRFHPIVFRESPRPSSDAGDDLQRFKSAAHHTDGVDTMAEAKAFIAGYPTWKDTGAVYEWDGKGVPALVCDFSVSELQ